MSVYVTTYEPQGEAIALFEAHSAAIAAQIQRCWDFVDSIGAVGYRPSRHASLQSIFFAGHKAPTGYRKVSKGGNHGDKIECVPSRNTKAGKAAEAIISEIGRPPPADDLAQHFGWDTSSFVMDGFSIFFTIFMEIDFPEKRYFLRLPRQGTDGWTKPETLRAVPESELMEAAAAQNVEAARRREVETKEEIEDECRQCRDQVDEAESWLEAVAAWEAAEKPRTPVAVSTADL